MKNGIELTEEQYKSLMGGTVFNTMSKEDMAVSLDNAKKQGYVVKSELEEAEESFSDALFKSSMESPDNMTISKACKYIDLLKAELERNQK